MGHGQILRLTEFCIAYEIRSSRVWPAAIVADVPNCTDTVPVIQMIRWWLSISERLPPSPQPSPAGRERESFKFPLPGGEG